MNTSEQSTEEFIKALQSLQVAKDEPVEYRLYYDEAGGIISCSMQNHPNGNYIVVTKDEYNRYFDYYVDNGKLTKVDRSIKYNTLLKKSDKGFKTVKGNASLIVEGTETYTDTENYAANN